jgi:hypothetical protein
MFGDIDRIFGRIKCDFHGDYRTYNNVFDQGIYMCVYCANDNHLHLIIFSGKMQNIHQALKMDIPHQPALLYA